MGVHDHGFNNVSTYGNLRRLMLEGRIARSQPELDFYEMALRCSGAVQASRWSKTIDGDGYLYSFCGPHSLFSDTIRSLRILALAHQLGHRLGGENDEPISLLDRLIQHARTTARYNVYYGEDRDVYDVRDRVVHESIFNCKDGRYRCPSTQQGYSPFSTWTRGLAWVIAGYAEQLEWLATRGDAELEALGGRGEIEPIMRKAAVAASDFYLENTPIDGIPYSGYGRPGLIHLGDYLSRKAEPRNDYEPVDSSAAAIAAQGLLRLGCYLASRGDEPNGQRYRQAGLTVLRTLLSDPYLSAEERHQGLLLHAVYHRPRGWDHVAEGAGFPAANPVCGEITTSVNSPCTCNGSRETSRITPSSVREPAPVRQRGVHLHAERILRQTLQAGSPSGHDWRQCRHPGASLPFGGMRQLALRRHQRPGQIGDRVLHGCENRDRTVLAGISGCGSAHGPGVVNVLNLEQEATEEAELSAAKGNNSRISSLDGRGPYSQMRQSHWPGTSELVECFLAW